MEKDIRQTSTTTTKKTGVAMLMLEKVDVKARSISRNKRDISY